MKIVLEEAHHKRLSRFYGFTINRIILFSEFYIIVTICCVMYYFIGAVTFQGGRDYASVLGAGMEDLSKKVVAFSLIWCVTIS